MTDAIDFIERYTKTQTELKIHSSLQNVPFQQKYIQSIGNSIICKYPGNHDKSKEKCVYGPIGLKTDQSIPMMSNLILMNFHFDGIP